MQRDTDEDTPSRSSRVSEDLAAISLYANLTSVRARGLISFEWAPCREEGFR